MISKPWTSYFVCVSNVFLCLVLFRCPLFLEIQINDQCPETFQDFADIKVSRSVLFFSITFRKIKIIDQKQSFSSTRVLLLFLKRHAVQSSPDYEARGVLFFFQPHVVIHCGTGVSLMVSQCSERSSARVEAQCFPFRQTLTTCVFSGLLYFSCAFLQLVY